MQLIWIFVAIVSLLSSIERAGAGVEDAPYHSPYDLAFAPDGRRLAVSDYTAGLVFIIDLKAGVVRRQIPLGGAASGLTWGAGPGGLYAADYESSQLIQIDADAGQVRRRVSLGAYPLGLALAPKRQILLAANSGADSVSLIDLARHQERARVAVVRQPFSIAVTRDEAWAVVSNFLPAGSAADPEMSASISLIDLDRGAPARNLRLPSGSTLVRQVAVSPDGRWAYAVHALARFAMPVSQLERGWVNGNALTIIDIHQNAIYTTVLLDQLAEGAADPWGLRVSPEGKTLWVTLAGVHAVARVDLGKLHALLAGELDLVQLLPNCRTSIWHEIRNDPAQRDRLINDLEALPMAGIVTRWAVPGKGPRGIDLSPDGRQLAVAAYFSGQVFLLDAVTGKLAATIALESERESDPARWGETIFNDATYSIQHWLSCATCHPDGRVDGVNWDLTNDGIGNGKNTRSLLLAHETPPMMALGVRANMEVATLAGFRFTLGHEPGPGEVEAVQAYLRAMKPARSPHLLDNGELSPLARRGQAIFQSPRTRCAFCHSGPWFTDLRLRNVGTGLPPETEAQFDTPTLIELWRTAPYLHHGGAATLPEVFTRFNPRNRHGTTSQLSAEDLAALAEYLLSL
jgi:YVTN family beta-propeller protein